MANRHCDSIAAGRRCPHPTDESDCWETGRGRSRIVGCASSVPSPPGVVFDERIQVDFGAVVIGLLATLLVEIVRQFVLVPFLGFSPKIMPGLLSVFLAAWLGGARAGWTAAALNTAKLWGYHVDGLYFPTLSVDRQIRLVMFFLIGGIISWVMGALHAAASAPRTGRRTGKRNGPAA